MSTLLKLTGLATFIAPFTNSVAIRKGDTIRVEDDVAEKLKEGFRVDREGNEVPYFVDAEETEFVTDYTKAATDPANAQPREKKMLTREPLNRDTDTSTGQERVTGEQDGSDGTDGDNENDVRLQDATGSGDERVTGEQDGSDGTDGDNEDDVRVPASGTSTRTVARQRAAKPAAKAAKRQG